MAYGPLIILSGPSGSGKSTVVQEVLRVTPLPLWRSVSATTRPQRPGEQDGVDYFFWPQARFEAEVQAGRFLEHAEVHGRLYGTPRSEVEARRAVGTGVLMVIDVQGAAQVRAVCPEVFSIFIRTPSLAVLEARLRGRVTDPEAVVQTRLANARAELARAGEYDLQIVNDDLPTAVAQVQAALVDCFAKGR
jgi:guanylate kinase